MSVNRKGRRVIAWGGCSLAAVLVAFGCAAQPSGPAATSVARHPDYRASTSSAKNEETAYTRQLKQRIAAPPPDAGARGDRPTANAPRSPGMSLPSVPDFVNELYAPEAPTP